MAMLPRATLSRLLCTWASAQLASGLVNSTGFTDCSCIDPKIAEHVNASECLPGMIDGVQICYPLLYGAMSCQKWDERRQPHCADALGNIKSNAPDWCKSSWCYVAGDSCSLEKQKSDYFPTISNLYFSYGTCESSASYETWKLTNRLKGVELRAHALDEPPNVYPDRDDGHPIGKGLIWDLYMDINQELGIIEKLQPKVMDDCVGSKWTCCVNKVAWGALDICYGTFWETPERRKITSFVSPIMVDNFYLVVEQKPPSQKLNLFAAFEPFTLRLWACILVTIVVVAFVMYELERKNSGDDHDDFKGEFWGDISNSLYLGCLGFWSGGPAHAPQSPGAKVVQVTFSLVLVLVLAGYTANLASFLVSSHDAESLFKDMGDVINSGYKVCVPEAVYSQFIDTHPSTVDAIIAATDTQDAWEKLSAGDCKGLINGQSENKRFLNNGDYCGFAEVGPSVLSIMLSQPINHEYVRSFSWMAVKNRNHLFNSIPRYEKQNKCAARKRSEEPDTYKLDIIDFIPVFGMLAIGIFLALGVRCVRLTVARLRRGKFALEHARGENQAEQGLDESGGLQKQEYDA